MNQFANKRRPIHDNSTIPNVIFFLLVSNGLMYAAQQLLGTQRLGYLALWPLNSGLFMPWQIVTYAFLHDQNSFMHILFNMFALWMFGRDVERALGARRFLVYYLASIIGAALMQLLVASIQGGIYPTLGASGGVFGILLAFGMFFPNRMVMLIFPPIPMRAKYFVIMFGVFELFMGVAGASPGIAHFAHLGGMLAGYLLLQFWRSRRTR